MSSLRNLIPGVSSGAGGPDLLAVDHPFGAVAPGAGAHRAHIGARVRLGHGYRHLDFPGEQLRYPAALLLLASFAYHVEAAKHAAPVRTEEVKALARKLLRNDHHVDGVAAQAAEFLGKGHAQQAHLDPGRVKIV